MPESDTLSPEAQAALTAKWATKPGDVVSLNHAGEVVIMTTNAEGRKVKKIIKKRKRPARPQVDPAEFKLEAPAQSGNIFNIWYNKWSGGDREDKYSSQSKAKGRCNVALDTGYTKADKIPGSYFCLFFARGLCPRGQDCDYLHRLPSDFDIYSGNVDCFGRDKHSDYRDDMGGVGSFLRQNRTLYIGRINTTPDIEEIVARHFNEWGKIERIRVLPARGVAFVTYVTEALAQFAKEAMAHQSLDNEEILNVRWATIDPNPASQKREKRKIEEQAAEAIRRALPEDFVKEIEGDQEAKRRRLEQGTFGLEGYKATDEVWFASQKAKREAQGASYGGELEDEQRLMLEAAADAQEGTDGEDEEPVVTGTSVDSGLFDASTLAALKKHKPSSQYAKAAPQNAGPLVGYGSDDDSD